MLIPRTLVVPVGPRRTPPPRLLTVNSTVLRLPRRARRLFVPTLVCVVFGKSENSTEFPTGGGDLYSIPEGLQSFFNGLVYYLISEVEGCQGI